MQYLRYTQPKADYSSDIKPANILINPESKEVKLIDFNIVYLLPIRNKIMTKVTV